MVGTKGRALAAMFWLLAAQASAQAAAPEVGPNESAAHTASVRPWWFGGELHLSVLSNLVDQSTINITFGYAGKAGYRWKADWGLFFQIEHNLWAETELEGNVRQGVLNIGGGPERLFFQRRMRTALGMGPAVLLYNTALDDAGTTGLFVDVRPTGIRWPVGKSFVLVFDPLTFTIVAPVLGGIPLVEIQYRSALALEYDWGH
jgi:hypothetical protein